jgi:hypothetical protein
MFVFVEGELGVVGRMVGWSDENTSGWGCIDGASYNFLSNLFLCFLGVFSYFCK